VLVALACTAGTPVARSDGNETKVPPPATAFSVPAIAAAKNKKMTRLMFNCTPMGSRPVMHPDRDSQAASHPLTGWGTARKWGPYRDSASPITLDRHACSRQRFGLLAADRGNPSIKEDRRLHPRSRSLYSTGAAPVAGNEIDGPSSGKSAGTFMNSLPSVDSRFMRCEVK